MPKSQNLSYKLPTEEEKGGSVGFFPAPKARFLGLDKIIFHQDIEVAVDRGAREGKRDFSGDNKVRNGDCGVVFREESEELQRSTEFLFLLLLFLLGWNSLAHRDEETSVGIAGELDVVSRSMVRNIDKFAPGLSGFGRRSKMHSSGGTAGLCCGAHDTVLRTGVSLGWVGLLLTGMGYTEKGTAVAKAELVEIHHMGEHLVVLIGIATDKKGDRIENYEGVFGEKGKGFGCVAFAV